MKGEGVEGLKGEEDERTGKGREGKGGDTNRRLGREEKDGDRTLG